MTDADDTMTITSNERRWVNKLSKLSDEHPGDVKIIANNEDGSVCAHAPKSWLRVSPPVTRSLTDAQREEIRDRLKRARDIKADRVANGAAK